jgi:hypothetical protein
VARVSPKGRSGGRDAGTDVILKGSDGIQPKGSGRPPVASGAAYMSISKGSTRGGSPDRGKGGKDAKKG